jgi:hypothetical protein
MKVLLYSLLREAAEAIADFQNADLRFESTRYTGVPVVGRSRGNKRRDGCATSRRKATTRVRSGLDRGRCSARYSERPEHHICCRSFSASPMIAVDRCGCGDKRTEILWLHPSALPNGQERSSTEHLASVPL